MHHSKNHKLIVTQERLTNTSLKKQIPHGLNGKKQNKRKKKTNNNTNTNKHTHKNPKTFSVPFTGLQDYGLLAR